jgi:hypothetical protein
MSIIDDVVKGVTAPLTEPISLLREIVSKFSSGKDKIDAELALANIEEEKEKRANELLIAQTALIQKEAQSGSLWNSGWHPFIGWVCGISLALYYIPLFVLASILWVTVFVKTGHLDPYPINPDSLFQLMWQLLGLGIYHAAPQFANILSSKFSK